jgi:hypothetical protein
MKLSPGIIVLLFGVTFAQHVFADTYSIYLFDVNPPFEDNGIGSFTYTPGANPFSNFTIAFNSGLFDLTSIANNTPAQVHGCHGGAVISFFTYLTTPDCQGPVSWTLDETDPGMVSPLVLSPQFNPIVAFPSLPFSFDQDVDSGPFSVRNTTTMNTPEPHSAFLISIALLAVAFVARKQQDRAGFKKGRGALIGGHSI